MDDIHGYAIDVTVLEVPFKIGVSFTINELEFVQHLKGFDSDQEFWDPLMNQACQ